MGALRIRQGVLWALLKNPKGPCSRGFRVKGLGVKGLGFRGLGVRGLGTPIVYTLALK